jgi:uncharacterized protein with PQ loop repeat
MAASSISVLAGITSTVIFAASALPMLVKAWRSRDLASYSRGNIVLSNIGNAVYSIYVFSMPAGPIWLLHSFYIVSSLLMLIWSVRYASAPADSSPATRVMTLADGDLVEQIAVDVSAARLDLALKDAPRG